MDPQDFITFHSQRHSYDSASPSTSSKTQFGEDINVKALIEDTMLYPDSAVSDLETRIMKYSKDYDFSISTSDTPSGKMSVFIDHDKPYRCTQFPYCPKPKY